MNISTTLTNRNYSEVNLSKMLTQALEERETLLKTRPYLASLQTRIDQTLIDEPELSGKFKGLADVMLKVREINEERINAI